MLARILRPELEVSVAVGTARDGRPRAHLTVHDCLPMTEANALWTQGPIDGPSPRFWATAPGAALHAAAFGRAEESEHGAK